MCIVWNILQNLLLQAHKKELKKKEEEEKIWRALDAKFPKSGQAANDVSWFVNHWCHVCFTLKCKNKSTTDWLFL